MEIYTRASCTEVIYISVSKFIISDTGEKVDSGILGCRTGPPRETERGGPCRPIATEVNRDSESTYDRVSFLGYVPP
jgi:hypothetical protein